MNKFFDLDGNFFKIMTRVADFIMLDLIMILFCLPVVTIGPAMSAAYYVAMKEIKDEEGPVLKSFWKAFKLNFKQGFLIELILILAGLMIYFDISITYNWAYSENSFIARLLFFALTGFGIVGFATVLYVFPMQAKFHNTVIKQLTNAVLMSVKHLPQTIIIVLINGGLMYATYVYPMFVVLSIAIMFYVNSYIMVRIFALYVPKTIKEEYPDEIHSDEMHPYID